MKKTLCLLAAMVITVMSMAQKKVAILETVDKAQNVNYGIKLLFRSTLATAITNTPGYIGLERVDLGAIVNEQKFQREGNVSDSQIKKIGEATGAAYVLVAEVANYDENSIIITAKTIDVETYIINSSAVLVSGTSPKDMQVSCANLAEQLLTPGKPSRPSSTTSQSSITAHTEGGLIYLTSMSDGTIIYVATEDEEMRMNHDDAVTTCSCKGEGWRLPNESELKIIRANRNNLGDISNSWRYWSSQNGMSIEMKSGKMVDTKNTVRAKVRCVREVKN